MLNVIGKQDQKQKKEAHLRDCRGLEDSESTKTKKTNSKHTRIFFVVSQDSAVYFNAVARTR